MPQTVLIAGTGRPYALGFNLVMRCSEHGDRVFAGVRRPSEALEALQKEYPDRLLFETKRHDKDGPVFITYTGEPYPWQKDFQNR